LAGENDRAICQLYLNLAEVLDGILWSDQELSTVKIWQLLDSDLYKQPVKYK
jgi:hypothetical protein